MSRRRTKSRPAGAASEIPPATGGSGPTAGSFALRRALPPIVIVTAGVSAYANSFDGAFVLDDLRHIVDNPRLRGGTARELLGVERPAVELSLALNQALHGSEVWGYHLWNLAVHLLAGLTLFGIVRRTLQLPALAPRYARDAPWLALATALLWVVHPLQTESVTYVIQRGESMMGLGYLLALYCLIRSAGSGRSGWTAGAIAAAVGGMASKAILITAPALLLLYDRIFLAPSFLEVWRRRWKLHVGVAAAVLGVGFATAIIPGVVESSIPREAGKWIEIRLGRAESPAQYYATQPEVVLHYLKLAFWPRVLVLDYMWPPVESLSRAVGPCLGLFALLGLTGWALLRAPPLGFLGAWFFVILAPTSAFWKLEVAFEHRMYLSLAAPVLLTVLAVHAVLRRMLGSGERVRSVGAVLLAAAALALGYRTSLRNLDYASHATMIRTDLAARPENDRLHQNLGQVLVHEGRIPEAIERFEEAIRLQPLNLDARIDLALTYQLVARHQDAILQLGYVLKRNPRHFRALSEMGSATLDRGVELKRQGREAEARRLLQASVGSFERALAQQPGDPDSAKGLARARVELGELGRPRNSP